MNTNTRRAQNGKFRVTPEQNAGKKVLKVDGISFGECNAR